MTLGAKVRLAGSLTVIVGVVTQTLVVNLLGLCLMAIGAVWQIDALEKRVEALEPKEQEDEKA